MTETPRISTALPGPNAQAIINRDKTVVSPSYTRGYPFVIARGEGAVLVDVYAALAPEVNANVSIDGLHLTPLGYRRVAETVFAAIRADLEIR